MPSQEQWVHDQIITGADTLVGQIIGVPRGPKARNFFVDTVNGDDDDNGLRLDRPLASVEAAEDLCTANQHDAVVMVGMATADNLTASIAWDKSYTHLVGLTNDLPGLGQRARMVGTAAKDLTKLIELSGNGCVFRNLQFFQGGDAAGAVGNVLVSGSRNYLKNVFCAGGGHATPAALPGMYSLEVTGDENYFEDCTIGLDTIIRTDGYELIVAAARNKFRHCEVRSYCETSGRFMVKIDNTADMRDTTFEDCLFFNYTVNWASGSANVFDMPTAGNTHYVILRGRNQLVGVGLGWADVVTHIYSADAAPNAGFGISTQPTT